MVKLLWMTRAEAGHLSRPETKEPRYVSSRAQARLLIRPLFLFVKQVNSYKSYAIKSFFPSRSDTGFKVPSWKQGLEHVVLCRLPVVVYSTSTCSSNQSAAGMNVSRSAETTAAVTSDGFPSGRSTEIRS